MASKRIKQWAQIVFKQKLKKCTYENISRGKKEFPIFRSFVCLFFFDLIGNLFHSDAHNLPSYRAHICCTRTHANKLISILFIELYDFDANVYF